MVWTPRGLRQQQPMDNGLGTTRGQYNRPGVIDGNKKRMEEMEKDQAKQGQKSKEKGKK